MFLKDLNEICKILCKYEPEFAVESGHDEIYLPGPEPSKMEKNDLIQLEALNARWQEDVECWSFFT